MTVSARQSRGLPREPARGTQLAPVAAHATHPDWLAEFAASYRDLLAFLRRRTGCAETARELTQDAWLRVAEHRGTEAATLATQPACSSHARAYLFTVAERLAIDHLRRQRHWDEQLAPRLAAGPQHAPDAAETHAHAQALRAVERALAAMPARTREVFVAHRLHGVPHDELASRHAVSRKTIEREISQAMDLAQAALEPAGTRQPQSPAPARRGRRKAMATLLGLGGMGGSAALLWPLLQARLPQWQTALSVPHGQTARLPLPDGSQLDLDAGSAVEVRLSGSRREVRLLRGNAFFTVARDAGRPFIVQAGPARITVLGTRFGVELQPQQVLVQVESGRVELAGKAGAPALQLGPGDSARMAGSGVPQPGPAQATESIARWRTGWIEFNQLPLAEAAEQLNRYRPAAPVRVDPAVGALPVLAVVNIARSTQWLQSLPQVLPVRVAIGAAGEVLITPR